MKILKYRIASKSDGILRFLILKSWTYFTGTIILINNLKFMFQFQGDSLFSIVRILLPMDDRSRPAYGIRAAVLGRIFAKVLALDKNSVDGKRLINFKNPGKAGAAAGNFGAVVYSVLETRFSNNTSKLGPTMSELHIVLDQLARDGNVTQEAQTRILQGFIRKITPLEGKWLSRILLKSVQLGLSSTQIFKIIHPKAKEMYDKTRDLEKVSFSYI